MQGQPRVAQCFREANVADAEDQKANAGPPEADAGPFKVTQGQCWAERLMQSRKADVGVSGADWS